MSDLYFETRTYCPACHCKETTLVYTCSFLNEPIKIFIDLKFNHDVQQYFENENYILKKCSRCKLIFQERILNKTGLELLYNKWLLHGDKEQFDLPKRTLNQFISYSQELLTIETFFGKEISDIKLLDYGMGSGQWCAVARDIGYDVTGTDVSEESLEHGRSLGLKVLPLSVFATKTYDFINSEQVFEHLSTPLEVLGNLKDALEPNGIIKISVPYGTNIEKKLSHMDWRAPRGHRNFLIPITPAIHINTYSQKSIIKMGATLGLKNVTPRSIFSEYRLINAIGPKELVKSAIRPIYRRLKKITYVYLQAQ